MSYDDTVLSRMSFPTGDDDNATANLRRVQTIKVASSQRKQYRMSIPSFMQSTNDDEEESRSFIPAIDSMTTVYLNSNETSAETIRILFDKHFIETETKLFSLYKVEKTNGNCQELNDDDFPLILRILAGPFDDVLFYLMEKRSK